VPTARTIPALVAAAADRAGDREAIVDGSVRWSFAELREHVERCAAALLALGVQPGDRVAVWAPNGHRFVVAALGAVSVGAVFVPINTRYKGEEAHWILDKSRARALLVQNGFLGNDYLDLLARAGKRPAALATVVDLADADADAHARADAHFDPAGSATVPWSSFLAAGAAVGTDAVRARAAAVRPDDPADMFFTSGTTGRPKGVLAGHEQNVRVYTSWADGVGLREGDRYLLVNPMFHTFGYKAGVLACLLRGATMFPLPVFDVPEVMRLVDAERITVLPGPPTLYSSVLDHPDRSRHRLGSLRLAITGAAVVPVALVERLRAELFPRVVIAYGLTESCGTATVGDPDADSATIARTVGRAIADTEVVVAGPDGLPLPAGQSGEVLVRGYNVMRGYFEDPAATAAAIDERGFLHTGDVGVLDETGNLRITDRIKDMFVVGGFNAYPAEIEQAIAAHPKVSEVGVIGVPDERLGEVGRAFVVARPGERLSEDEIIAFCRQRLANFKVPRSVRVVESLPRNPSGKILKYRLREQA
jgi:acyl-CoA synthetase (AMP-forming)/AMP-acid ligase II